MNIEPKQPTRKGPADWFTGDVYIDAISIRKPEPSRMACGCVHFTPGARTAWHSHAVGQTLYVTEGTALLGTRDGTVIAARKALSNCLKTRTTARKRSKTRCPSIRTTARSSRPSSPRRARRK